MPVERHSDGVSHERTALAPADNLIDLGDERVVELDVHSHVPDLAQNCGYDRPQRDRPVPRGN